MSKKLQISIPIPCRESWDAMTPVEKGRFCDSCQKKVVDFSMMSDREIGLFFKKSSNGSVCGRFMDDQLNRDIEIPKKRIPWIKYFFQIALPAFMVSAKASAQGKVEVNVKTEVVDRPLIDRQNNSSVIASKHIAQTSANQIVNPLIKSCISRGSVMVGGIIFTEEIIKYNTPSKLKTKKKTSIRDTMTTIPIGHLIVSKQLSQLSVRPEIKPDNIVVADLKDTLVGRLGGVFVGVNITTPKPDTLFTRLVKKYFPDSFKIFPNPVEAGGILHIEWKENETGDYLMQLINQSGQTILNKVMWIDAEARLLELQLPSVSAGVYFLHISNKQSGKRFTEKIVIQ